MMDSGKRVALVRDEHEVVSMLPKLLNDNSDDWRLYWSSLGLPWRTEPEIHSERQAELALYRQVSPDIAQQVYPFNGIKLNRADIEWLLATHEEEQGPIQWDDERQRNREGLDLRGADVQPSVNLSKLPLAGLRAGLERHTWNGRKRGNEEQLSAAAVHMEGCDLYEAHLEHAHLAGAYLQGADLRLAHLEGADLRFACLAGANLSGANLNNANLTGANLENAYLTAAKLDGTKLHGANLSRALLFGAHLHDAFLVGTHLEGANFTGAQLDTVDLRRAQMENTNFTMASLKNANLAEANLSAASFKGAQLTGVNLANVVLADNNHIGPQMVDVQLEHVSLGVMNWSEVRVLKDEFLLSQQKSELKEYKEAMRANRQLALALHAQGLSEEAAYFAYRAQTVYTKMLQHQISREQNISTRIRLCGRYLVAIFRELLAGSGYQSERSALASLLLILAFTTGYSLFTRRFLRQ